MATKNKLPLNVTIFLVILGLMGLFNIYSLYLYFAENFDILNFVLSLFYYGMPLVAIYLLITKKSYALIFTKIYVFFEAAYYLIIGILSVDYYYLIYAAPLVILSLLLLFGKSITAYYSDKKSKSEGFLFWAAISLIYPFIMPVYGLLFSIWGLRRDYKNKIIFIIGIILSVGMFAYNYFFGTPALTAYDSQCITYCTGIENATYYLVEADNITDAQICYCMDNDSAVISQLTLPIE
ncbi:hypothetical protein COX58_02860 [archaeon CG_4_10_14_0_2_um_filter_Archaea_38_6]|nr:MAG: hypothetical protein COS64_04090 [archaeon CG06_land_8_20_14_3_00_37_11]PJA22086.1 MAG: hypothetical protein COX58_02860 [archaeon CG_4_10_14_0_2_um_filter_Archaea_38_6]